VCSHTRGFHQRLSIIPTRNYFPDSGDFSLIVHYSNLDKFSRFFESTPGKCVMQAQCKKDLLESPLHWFDSRLPLVQSVERSAVRFLQN